MISNFWEEQLMNNAILDFQKDLIAGMGLPEWTTNIQCPFCKEHLSIGCLRSISMKLNTRNYGDLAVEFICNHCRKLDTLYFRKEIEHVSDFVNLLSKDCHPKSNPIVEEEMYKLQYNNAVEKMIKKEKGNDTI